MVFLSYPKYYKTALGQLVPVQTALVTSADPSWDYEVIQGIWTLRVKKDGTFEAEHEGDVFTYRFNSLGTGRGSGFKTFELGEPNYSRFIVTGDTIRWSDVYPDIDVSVRYVHDILKVDVIVKNAFMADLKAEAKAGKLNQNDYLTARFDILQALITGKAKQNGQDKDVYAESLAIDQPLYFEKNGKVVHKLRPVETYLLDGKGDPIDNPEKPIRSTQVWNLKSNAPGVAEMSALIADLVELPKGDVDIDPTLIFDAGYYTTKDTRFSYQSPSTNYGVETTVNMIVGGGSDSDRAMFAFDIRSMTAAAVIQSASLHLYLSNISIPYSPAAARVFKVTEDWNESTATFTTHSRSYNETAFYGNSYTLGSTSGIWVDFDATYPCKSHIQDGSANVINRGFLLRFIDNQYETATFRSKEYSSSYRPALYIKYTLPSLIGSLQVINFDGLNDPQPDNEVRPVYINNQWYAHITAPWFFPTRTPATNTSKNYVIAINDANGLAASNINLIQDNLLRVTPGNPTPVPGPSGTPFPSFGGFANQLDTVPPSTPGQWYARLAAITSHYQNTPTPLIHSFFHAEDSYNNVDGQTYGMSTNSGMRIYQRIGYLRSTDGINFTQINGNPSGTNNRETGAMLECFESEYDYLYPYGVPTPNGTTPTPTPNPTYTNQYPRTGARHPYVIEKDNYLYMFYDRLLTRSYVQARLTPIPNPHPDADALKKTMNLNSGGHPHYLQSICLARAGKSDFLSFQPTPGVANPWKNYYNDGVSDAYDGFTESAMGGWSSPVVDVSGFSEPMRELPSVCYNSFLSSYLMLTRASFNNKLYPTIHINLNEVFTSWTPGLRIDIFSTFPSEDFGLDGSKLNYPYFINLDPNWSILGNDKSCGMLMYLYFAKLSNPNNDGMGRVRFEFQ